MTPSLIIIAQFRFFQFLIDILKTQCIIDLWYLILKKVNVIRENQFGSMNNHSAIHALVLVAGNIQKAIDERTKLCLRDISGFK